MFDTHHNGTLGLVACSIQILEFEYLGFDWRIPISLNMQTSHSKLWFVGRHVWTIAHFWFWMAVTMNIHSKLCCHCCWRRLDHFEWEPNWSKKWPCSVPPACPLFKVCTHIHKCRFDLWSNKRFLSNISIIKIAFMHIFFSGYAAKSVLRKFWSFSLPTSLVKYMVVWPMQSSNTEQTWLEWWHVWWWAM